MFGFVLRQAYSCRRNFCFTPKCRPCSAAAIAKLFTSRGITTKVDQGQGNSTQLPQPMSAKQEAPTQLIDDATKGLQQLDVKEKKPKQRKAQSDEEFLEQKRQFLDAGPQINTDTWLFDEDRLHSLDSTKKLDRVHILHACEKAYFLRDYEKCLELIKVAGGLFHIELDNETVNDDLKIDFQNAGRKTRKSTKVERHVVDLLHIKEACLKRMSDA